MSGAPKVLVVDDDPVTRLLMRRLLEREHFVVHEAESGREGLAAAGEVDIVLLDLTLPDMHGFDVLRDLRAGSAIPVILVTAHTSEQDRVQGLDLGADDYVVKPFLFGELVARVRSVLRRAAARDAPRLIRHDGLTVNLSARAVDVRGARVHLAAKEFDLLAHLAAHPGRVFSREELLRAVWGSRTDWQDPATVTEHVRRLRLRLEEDPANPRWIRTARGAGYRFDP